MFNQIKILSKKFNTKYLIFCITIFVSYLLILFGKIYVFNFKFKEDKNYTKYEVDIIQKSKISDDKITYLVKCMNNKFLLNIYIDEKLPNEQKNMYENMTYGDKVEIMGKISYPQKLNNPYEFDYKKYLNSNNIVANITGYKINKINHTKGNFVYYYILKFRDSIYSNINKYAKENEMELFKALMYSDKLELGEDEKNLFEENGLVHMIAVSGMHISYLMCIVKYFTSNLKNWKKILLDIIILIIYISMSMFSISAIRAVLMYIISAILSIFGKNRKYVPIFLTFIIMNIFNPYIIFNASFLLSFFASFGIICLSSQINSFFNVYLKLEKMIILKYIFNMLSISLSSSIFILPFQIIFFGNFNLKLFISNIVALPFISLFYSISFLFIFLSQAFFIKEIIAMAISVMLKCIIFVLKFLNAIKLPNILLPRLNVVLVIMYYFSIFVVLTRKYIPKYFKKKYWKKLKFSCHMLPIVNFLIIFLCIVYIKYIESYVCFFNVGQGNMSIIRKGGKTVIYDMGSTTQKLGYNVCSNFLKSKAISKIDMIILSHMHEDHTNAIYDIVKKYDVGMVIYPVTYEMCDEYTNISKLLNEKNIKFTCAFEDTFFNVGKSIEIEILSPKQDEKINSNDVLNANSIVSILTIKKGYLKNDNYLFMGDATKETEKYILDKKLRYAQEEKLKNIKCIQIGHHGSKTSTSEEFLKKVNPCYALISSKKKVYGHPSQDTLELLKKYNFKIVITEENGALLFNE